MLELTDIYKSYKHNGNTIDVLKGISITINQGDTLAIIGASGAGKSTLLNIMGGLERPSSGHVKIQGRDIVDLDETALCGMRNRDVGFVFQFHHLLPEFNAIENTLMPALISRMRIKEATEMARNMLAKVGLENRLSHRIGELSGGEQQRVAIARALMMRPKVLLADEPTGNLDRNTGKEVVDLLLRIREEEGLSMVIVTHNQQLADNMTKVMEIVDGKLQ
jgi:lipoprotein-releasing system ATP-binding protein